MAYRRGGGHAPPDWGCRRSGIARGESGRRVSLPLGHDCARAAVRAKLRGDEAKGAKLMTDILDLGGRVALVTGAGQGVGRQIALQLADALGSGGVVVNDYVLSRAEAVAEEIKAAGGKAIA